MLVKNRRNCGNGVNYRARVHIPQNDLPTLHAFQDRVGVHCKLIQLPHRESYTRPIYQLNFDGVHAFNLLKKLRPYLVRKAAEADVILSTTAHANRHGTSVPKARLPTSGMPVSVVMTRCVA